MQKLVMLDDHDGARAGDVVGFESDLEAQAVVKSGKGEPWLNPNPPAGADDDAKAKHEAAVKEQQDRAEAARKRKADAAAAKEDVA